MLARLSLAGFFLTALAASLPGESFVDLSITFPYLIGLLAILHCVACVRQLEFVESGRVQLERLIAYCPRPGLTKLGMKACQTFLGFTLMTTFLSDLTTEQAMVEARTLGAGFLLLAFLMNYIIHTAFVQKLRQEGRA